MLLKGMRLYCIHELGWRYDDTSNDREPATGKLAFLEALLAGLGDYSSIPAVIKGEESGPEPAWGIIAWDDQSAPSNDVYKSLTSSLLPFHTA